MIYFYLQFLIDNNFTLCSFKFVKCLKTFAFCFFIVMKILLFFIRLISFLLKKKKKKKKTELT
ncbi:hypothetical protein Hdeb2414_s0789g00947091 [Helianthus debilis subsp. tardiflorus]